MRTCCALVVLLAACGDRRSAPPVVPSDAGPPPTAAPTPLADPKADELTAELVAILEQLPRCGIVMWFTRVRYRLIHPAARRGQELVVHVPCIELARSHMAEDSGTLDAFTVGDTHRISIKPRSAEWELVSASSASLTARFVQVSGTGYDGIIDTSGDWIPTAADVVALEEILATAVVDHEVGTGRVPAIFKRQYVWRLVNRARKIHVRLTCHPDADWATKGVPLTKGGGRCYVSGWFDVSAGKLTSLRGNAGK